MKNTIIFLLILAICFPILTACNGGDNNISGNNGVQVFEPSKETPAEDFEFESGKNGLIVTKYTGNAKSVSIPSVHESKKVVDLNADVFAGNIVLEEITLPKYMTTLDLADFKDCDNLKTVNYLGNITSFASGKGPENLETLRLVGASTFGMKDIQEIFGRYEKLKNLDISAVTTLTKSLVNYSGYSLDLEGANLNISESALDELKIKKFCSLTDTYFYYNYYDDYSGEYYEDYLIDETKEVLNYDGMLDSEGNLLQNYYYDTLHEANKKNNKVLFSFVSGLVAEWCAYIVDPLGKGKSLSEEITYLEKEIKIHDIKIFASYYDDTFSDVRISDGYYWWSDGDMVLFYKYELNGKENDMIVYFPYIAYDEEYQEYYGYDSPWITDYEDIYIHNIRIDSTSTDINKIITTAFDVENITINGINYSNN